VVGRRARVFLSDPDARVVRGIDGGATSIAPRQYCVGIRIIGIVGKGVTRLDLVAGADIVLVRHIRTAPNFRENLFAGANIPDDRIAILVRLDGPPAVVLQSPDFLVRIAAAEDAVDTA